MTLNIDGQRITIIEDFGWGFCKRCGKHKDLRFGVCFHCATDAEKEADLRMLGILGEDEAWTPTEQRTVGDKL